MNKIITSLDQDLAEMEKIPALTKELKVAASNLSRQEARFLVNRYYQMQDERKRANQQLDAASKSNEPNKLFIWLGDQNQVLENRIGKALDIYSGNHPMGQWMRSIKGIGPVISAGMLAYIDIHEAPTAGHIWRFAGLDPSREWLGAAKAAALVKETIEKLGPNASLVEVATAAFTSNNTNPSRFFEKLRLEETKLTQQVIIDALAKRPWSNNLKVLCWKLGEAFVKVSNYEDDFYGKLYIKRKQREWQKNLAGDFEGEAEKSFKKMNYGRSTEAYKWYTGQYTGANLASSPIVGVNEEGKRKIKMLSPAHIYARAKRYAVTIFISHLQEVWWRYEFGTEPPKPFVMSEFSKAKHTHYIAPPMNVPQPTKSSN